MKKILITYVSYGSGHKTIAKYIYDYIKDNPEYEIKIVDLLDYMDNKTLGTVKAFNYIYNHRMEHLFNALYKASDNELINKEYQIYVKSLLYNKKIENLFVDFNPDVVFSTHFYGSNISSYMKKCGLINPKIVTLVTDYRIHKMWMSSYDKSEIFVVASDIVKKDMINRGCYSKHIYAFGLPYNIEKVHEMLSRKKIISKYHLNPYQNNILFFGGGSNGSNAYYRYLKKLLKLNPNYQILFICGKNASLFEKVSLLKKKYSNLKVFKFITNVYELLEISDLIITKPGGATVTECLEMQRMMLLLPGIGGQEDYNADFVVKNHYGYKVRGLFSFKHFMKDYISNPEVYIDKYNSHKLNNESLEKIKELIEKL